MPATGFENAELFARRVTLSGTDGPNDLGLTACLGKVKGRAGADTVRRAYHATFETDLGCRERLVINGGRGHDVLVGGPGRDRADGGKGRDRCVAERKRRCER